MEEKKVREVFWSELVSGLEKRLPKHIEDKEELWKAHTKLAVELAENMKGNRMQIAELAERSCVIMAGGDRKSEKFEGGLYRLSLKSFCRETRLTYTTVNTWILVKNRVYKYLPKRLCLEDFNLTAAKNTGEKLRDKGFYKHGKEPSSAQVIDLYKAEAHPDEKVLRKNRILAYLRQSHYYLVQKNMWYLLSADETEMVRSYCRELLSHLQTFGLAKHGGKVKK